MRTPNVQRLITAANSPSISAFTAAFQVKEMADLPTEVEVNHAFWLMVGDQQQYPSVQAVAFFMLLRADPHYRPKSSVKSTFEELESAPHVDDLKRLIKQLIAS